MDDLGVIMDVSELAGYRNAFSILRPLTSVVIQRLLGVEEMSAMQEVAAYHRTRSTFAGFTMDDGDVVAVRLQPFVDVDAERFD